MNSLKTNKTLTLILIFVLSFLTKNHWAQNGTNQLIINTKDSSYISVYVNQKLISSVFTKKILIENLRIESHLISIALDSSLQIINKTIFFEKKETIIYLELIINDSIPQLIYNGESKIKDFERDSNQVVYIYYDSIVVLDSTSNLKIPLINSDLIKYNGPKGCERYINDVDSILVDLDNIFSSEKKMNYLKGWIVVESILNNLCLSTKHLKILLESIPYEDHRIELCEKLYPDLIYDLDNFHSLIELFKFEKSKNLFLKIIEEND
ncbi:MAG: DUF4476 domain-containing protein [Flavobacteriales bacterium]|nr:DUF4476 domain-containing protein [Flavobacteriales bacterium]